MSNPVFSVDIWLRGEHTAATRCHLAHCAPALSVDGRRCAADAGEHADADASPQAPLTTATGLWFCVVSAGSSTPTTTVESGRYRDYAWRRHRRSIRHRKQTLEQMISRVLTLSRTSSRPPPPSTDRRRLTRRQTRHATRLRPRCAFKPRLQSAPCSCRSPRRRHRRARCLRSVQRQHAILRNFPVIGHFATGRSDWPLNFASTSSPITTKSVRSAATSAAGLRVVQRENNYFGFGSDKRDEQAPSYSIIKHRTFPLQSAVAGEPGYDAQYRIPSAKVLGGARGRAKAFRPASVVNVSGMSFGALSGPAVRR